MIFNLPNSLTWLRILAIPLVVVLFLVGLREPSNLAGQFAAIVFALAAITDSLDGYLARRLGQITRLGAFLDPVADKLIVTAALVLLVSRNPRLALVLSAIVIIGREIAISALREWMAELGQRGAVAVSSIGKYKTIVQMVGLTLMLWSDRLFGLPIYEIGLWLTVVAAVLTIVSALLYLQAAWPHLREPRDL
ncbi:MAG TPA: CDP-diacylglycerol--glycerol-3-phosphate 3-phosphatidyltransferase [Steroidobacteraceae bacterium]|nr:CDP-diacylglycerol--glycerol-3-phosphate 3-phosphatidyltransferase [Steroidobacteraceae bacterium]